MRLRGPTLANKGKSFHNGAPVGPPRVEVISVTKQFLLLDAFS